MNVTIREYIEREFSPGSRPSVSAVRRWIKRGNLPYPARRLGRTWYIELTPRKKSEPEPEPEPEVTRLMQKVINS